MQSPAIAGLSVVGNEGFKAQDKMLDRYMKENNLQDQDWRPKMYEQLKEK